MNKIDNQNHVAIKKSRRKRLDEFTNFLIIFPPILGFLLVSCFPLVLSLIMTFFKMNSTIFSEATFVGFDNYVAILVKNLESVTSGYAPEVHIKFYRSFLNLIIYWLSVPISMVLGLMISFLINKNIKCKRLFRTVFFIPYVCSIVALSYSFKTMYDYNFGVLNSILNMFGIDKWQWINSDNTFQWGVMFMNTWKSIGYSVILFQAALARVDESLYEAARVDGANDAQMFWKITWQAISPVTFFLLTMNTIGTLQSMAEQQLLFVNNSGLEYGYYTPAYYMYDMMFLYVNSLGYGIAAAVGWLLAIFIMIITQINLRLSKKWVHYEF